MKTSEEEAITATHGAGASDWTILVHGGAGDVRAASIPAHVAGCERAAEEGAKILAQGGSALDAAQRAVEVLEADPLFNAGTGGSLDSDGQLSLDASIMDGEGLRAGAVSALPPFEHPIAIARRVMEDTPHVLLTAEGAARFARSHGFTPASDEAMITEAARVKWRAAQANRAAENWAGGTVGAVARDARGHVAAATSTGGMVNKLAGRVGDSPIIGAGTYADDEAGACSTTGHGEAMLRVCLAKLAVDRMRDDAPEAAARVAMARMHARTLQTGGVILVGRDGSLGLARTTKTMTWASVQASQASPSGHVRASGS